MAAVKARPAVEVPASSLVEPLPLIVIGQRPHDCLAVAVLPQMLQHHRREGSPEADPPASGIYGNKARCGPMTHR